MNASLELPDGALAVQRQGGAADLLNRFASVAPKPEPCGEDSGRRAARGGGDAKLHLVRPQASRLPPLDVVPGEGDLQRDHVLEQPFAALAQLPASRHVA